MTVSASICQWQGRENLYHKQERSSGEEATRRDQQAALNRDSSRPQYDSSRSYAGMAVEESEVAIGSSTPSASANVPPTSSSYHSCLGSTSVPEHQYDPLTHLGDMAMAPPLPYLAGATTSVPQPYGTSNYPFLGLIVTTILLLSLQSKLIQPPAINIAHTKLVSRVQRGQGSP